MHIFEKVEKIEEQIKIMENDLEDQKKEIIKYIIK